MKRPGPWVALDTGFFDDERVEELSPAAVLLYLAALCHCGEHLTDGRISKGACGKLLGRTGAKPKNVRELERNGLWTGEGPWEVSGYLTWQLSRAEHDAHREANARRQAAFRERRNAQGNGERNALRGASRHAPRNRHIGVDEEKDLELRTTTPLAAEPPSTLDDVPGRPDTMPPLSDVLRAV